MAISILAVVEVNCRIVQCMKSQCVKSCTRILRGTSLYQKVSFFLTAEIVVFFHRGGWFNELSITYCSLAVVVFKVVNPVFQLHAKRILILPRMCVALMK